MNDKNYEAEIQRLNTESVEVKRRLEQLETNDRKRDEDIRQLFVSTKGIEVMQSQIMSRFDSLESRVFAHISQMQTSLVQSQQQMQQQSQQQTQAMQDLFKQVFEQQQEDRQDERDHSKTWLQQFVDNNKTVITLTIGTLIAGVVSYLTIKFGK